jgi:Bacterial nucleoid DNA-binding protein
MTHKDFIDKLSERLQWPESKITEMLGATVRLLNERLSEGVLVSMENLGDFRTEKNPEYISVNTETKERYLMPPSFDLHFEAASGLKYQLESGLKE